MLLASTAPKLLAPWADRKILAGFAIATTVGVLVAAYPLPALGGLAVCASLYLTVCWCRGRMEFWQGRPNRLHDRFRYSRQADGSWSIDRLAP